MRPVTEERTRSLSVLRVLGSILRKQRSKSKVKKIKMIDYRILSTYIMLYAYTALLWL
jgi:hypothetical protein